MLGTTLRDLRTRIEQLASPSGEYYLVCARYGDRPVPASGLRFESRETARAAARATERYRSALRRYDPQLPWYDVVACQGGPSEAVDHPSSGACDCADGGSTDEWTLSEPACTNRQPDRRERAEFCHSVAAAVFETLSDGEFDAVESVVLDRYLELVETISDPDHCCLCLLETMAAEIASRLSPADQFRVLSRAASRLEPVDTSPGAPPIDATLTHLRAVGVLGSYSCSAWPRPAGSEPPTGTVSLANYALSPCDGRLPTLPIVVDLYRRDLEWYPQGISVTKTGDEWRLDVALSRTPCEAGLVSAPSIIDRY